MKTLKPRDTTHLFRPLIELRDEARDRAFEAESDILAAFHDAAAQALDERIRQGETTEVMF